jgi:hypothetical protein
MQEHDWMTIERPGYFGKLRDELISSWDNKYGLNNWRLAWQWGKLIIPKREAIQIYEDGYYEFLKSDSRALDWLLNTAGDVYDTAPSNVQAGLNYEHQETKNTHLHDVAIRRAVFRLGKAFRGEKLLHVRGKGTQGEFLSPHMVPFHLPRLISQEEIKDYSNKGKWWLELGVKNSIEEFYQHNKLLQIRA